MIELASDRIVLIVDPDHGADILSLRFDSGDELLFETPWRAQADHAVRTGVHPMGASTQAQWMGRYRGGWQTLCPNAGPDREREGSSLAYHGEASVVAWRVAESTREQLWLTVELVSAPVAIDRRITVEGGTVTIRDVLTNLSTTEVECDYIQHPAFGEAFLRAGARILTMARTFHPDPESPMTVPLPDPTLIIVPEACTPPVFGWLSDFEESRVDIQSLALGLTVRLTWDGETLPHAWLWCELGSTPTWPWFSRARAIAVEPSSTSTSGPTRERTLTLAPSERRTIWTALTVEATPPTQPT